jgi:predicted enzyme related to lactoylglutathione lyase
MPQYIGLVSLLVRDHDEAIAFYTRVLGFTTIEDKQIPEQQKRWVVVAPPDDFHRAYAIYQERGVKFVRKPQEKTCGMVAMFQDPYGNRWDLIGPHPLPACHA